MTSNDRRRLRAAVRIHERLTAGRDPAAAPLLPLDTWDDLVTAARRVVLAEQHGWSVAAASSRATFRRLANALIDRLSRGVAAAEGRRRSVQVQSPAEVLAELVALEQEFDEVEIALTEQKLSVTTDPIVFEGVHLGRFRVVLHWDELPEASSYSVIALDPNPAAHDETTPHPHVREDTLCEGDGRSPIRSALEEGRLLDFFLLINSILTTYNPSSAYVQLSRWNGAPCTDCGCTSAEDESTCCDRCDRDVCFDCSAGCNDCGRTCCSDCRGRCDGCGELFCSACLTSCRSCSEDFCGACLEEGACSVCRDEEVSQTPEPTDEETYDGHNDPEPRGGETEAAEAAALSPAAA